MKKLKLKKDIEIFAVLAIPENVEEINSIFNQESTPEVVELEWNKDEDALVIYHYDGENHVNNGDAIVFYSNSISGFLIEYEILSLEDLFNKYEYLGGNDEGTV